MSNEVIVASSLSKCYGKVKALDEVNLSVYKGEIFGILGPSGSGKTTLLKILTGQLMPSNGHVCVLDKETRNFDGSDFVKLGVMLDNIGLYQRLTCMENLRVYAMINEVKVAHIFEILKTVDLLDAKDRQVHKLSKGMAQRLSLACSVMHNPKILFLDEPTSGLDPVTTGFIHDLILNLRKSGTIIVMATHDMNEATKLCDRVALLNEGKVIECDTPSRICQKNAKEEIIRVHLINDTMEKFDMSETSRKRIAHLFEQNQVLAINTEHITLEMVFIELTGRRLE